jgi:hypothetical protein
MLIFGLVFCREDIAMSEIQNPEVSSQNTEVDVMSLLEPIEIPIKVCDMDYPNCVIRHSNGKFDGYVGTMNFSKTKFKVGAFVKLHEILNKNLVPQPWKIVYYDYATKKFYQFIDRTERIDKK